MRTERECKSSFYVTYYVICPDCNKRAGYHSYFDFKMNSVFKCKCGYGIRQIKKLEEDRIKVKE